MSYVVHIWQQPENKPLPSTLDEASDIFSELHDWESKVPNSLFQQLSLRLSDAKLCGCFLCDPDGNDEGDADCVWLEGGAPSGCGMAFNAPINTHTDQFDIARCLLIHEAVALGLNVLDPQSGAMYLKDGTVVGLSDIDYCMDADFYLLQGKYQTACQKLRPLAASGNAHAIYKLAQLFRNGLSVSKSLALAHALFKYARQLKPQRYQDDEELFTLPADLRDKADALLRDLTTPGNFNAALERAIAQQQSELEQAQQAFSKESFTEAYSLLVPLYKDGNPTAHYLLGCMYRQGNKVKKSSEIALQLFLESAKSGLVAGQFAAAQILESGAEGVTQDISQAINLYLQVIANIGMDHDTLHIITQAKSALGGLSASKAYSQQKISALTPLAEAGNAEAQYLLANHYLALEQTTEALKWLKAAIQRNNLSAITLLGIMYVNGCGVDKNVQEGIKLLTKTADLNDVIAQYHLGLTYLKGKDVTPDEKLGLVWLRKSAQYKYPKALYALGELYQHGQFVPQNHIAHLALHMIAKLAGYKGEVTLAIDETDDAKKMRQLVEALLLTEREDERGKCINMHALDAHVASTPSKVKRHNDPVIELDGEKYTFDIEYAEKTIRRLAPASILFFSALCGYSVFLFVKTPPYAGYAFLTGLISLNLAIFVADKPLDAGKGMKLFVFIASVLAVFFALLGCIVSLFYFYVCAKGWWGLNKLRQTHRHQNG